VGLEHEKCGHCPLNESEYPECPVARSLAPVVDAFEGEKSFEKVSVEVETPERSYRREAPLQDGLFSLVGLLMATSDCPHMAFLRPSARFHLPFSTSRERSWLFEVGGARKRSTGGAGYRQTLNPLSCSGMDLRHAPSVVRHATGADSLEKPVCSSRRLRHPNSPSDAILWTHRAAGLE
jgi:hypothetical protein